MRLKEDINDIMHSYALEYCNIKQNFWIFFALISKENSHFNNFQTYLQPKEKSKIKHTTFLFNSIYYRFPISLCSDIFVNCLCI